MTHIRITNMFLTKLLQENILKLDKGVFMAQIIGILGAGQLASMLAQSAKKKGLNVAVFANDLSEPACAFADNVMLAEVDLESSLKPFFSFCSLIILENEFFHPDLLVKMEQLTHTKVFPELKAYEKLYSKTNQKKFFQLCNLPMAQTHFINDENDLVNVKTPVMLKLATGGYDGLGNLKVLKNETLFEKAIEFSNNFEREIFAEELIDIKNEYACMLVKGENTSLILPPVETIQRYNVCQQVNYPAELSSQLENQLLGFMRILDEYLEGVGIFAFEFFETKTGELLINEAAPRVHNSYHFSIEGFDRSQFDLMLDIALGVDVSSVNAKYNYLSMINLLGQREAVNYNLEIPELQNEYDYKVHMYGKKDSRPGRKLGHITIFSDQRTNKHAKRITKEYRL